MLRKLHLLWTLLLIVPICVAGDTSSTMPVKQWLANTSRVLAEAAKGLPSARSDRMWEALDRCVPEQPVELRAIIKSVRWKDGTAKVSIDRPLGWPASTGVNPPAVFYTNTFFVIATEEQAIRMKGSWLILQGEWGLLRDYGEVLKEKEKRCVLARVSVGDSRSGYFVSNDLTVKIRGEELALDFNAAF